MAVFTPDVIKLSKKRKYKGLIKALSPRYHWKVRSNAARELGNIANYFDSNKIPSAIIIGPLISTLLRDEESLVRKNAAEALEKIRDKEAVEPLIAALDDPEDNVKRAAASALGWIRDKRAVEPLIRRINNNRLAIEALGHIRDKRAVKPLIELIKSDPYQIVAIDALGKIGDPCAVKPLLEARLESENYNSPKLSSVRTALGEAVDAALVKIGEPAIESLVAAARDQKFHYSATKALVKIDPEQAIEPLIAALKNKNRRVRLTAASFLGKIGDERAILPLLAGLESGEEAFVDYIEKIGWRPDCGEAGAAYWAAKKKWDKCVQIGQPAVEPLISALQRGEEGAAIALAKIGDKRAVKPLIASLTIIPNKAADALDLFNWQPDQAEAGAAYWAAREKWDKCVQIGQPAVEPLISALKRGEEAAAKALGEIGDRRAVKPLISALEYYVPEQPDYEEDPWKYDSDECKSYRVRAAAVRALGKIGDSRAVKHILRISENLRVYDREIEIGWGYAHFKKQLIDAAADTLNILTKKP